MHKAIIVVALLGFVCLAQAQVSQQAFQCIFPRVSSTKVSSWMPHLNNVLRKYSINNFNRIAMFLAQTGHETDSYNTFKEYTNRDGTNAWCHNYNGGCTYRGRGAMQLTHRYNYERAGSALGQNFVGNPDLVAELPWAFETAGLFWNWNNLNALADANDIVGTTRKINGGQNGIDDRRAKWSSAKSCMQRYPSGGSPPPPTPVPSPVPSGGCRTYTVRSGDSLSAIAARFGTTVVAIARTNGITNVNLIRVGQVLRIC